VGAQNISEEPAIFDSYAWRSGMFAGMVKFMPRFEAVVLPKDTEEVQAIVKLCNRYKIKFKASSTGWGGSNSPGGAGVIQLDLRRMNRIIEINEENMYAVVEPHVIGAQLQAELMKRGLNFTITGPVLRLQHFPDVHSHGFMSQTTGLGERNVYSGIQHLKER
jgi:glycolate oxidase